MTTSQLPPDAAHAPSAERELMSSLADGGLADPGTDLPSALAVWRQDADARQAWHSYHLIGDVMRSEDLAVEPGRDEDFLRRLRDRMESEPVHLGAAVPVLVPVTETVPVPVLVRAGERVQPLRGAWGDPWRAGAALAASVAVAAVVLLVSRPGATGADASAPVVASSGAPSVSALPAVAVNAVVLRDPRLDEFLLLHQMARGGLPMGAPGGTLQRADLQMPVGSGR